MATQRDLEKLSLVAIFASDNGRTSLLERGIRMPIAAVS